MKMMYALVAVIAMLVGTTYATVSAGIITAGGYEVEFPVYPTVAEGSYIQPSVEVNNTTVIYTLTYVADISEKNSLGDQYMVIVNPQSPINATAGNVTGTYNGYTLIDTQTFGVATKDIGNIRIAVLTKGSNGNLVGILDNIDITKL